MFNYAKRLKSHTFEYYIMQYVHGKSQNKRR
jgi:hypothetical protein